MKAICQSVYLYFKIVNYTVTFLDFNVLKFYEENLDKFGDRKIFINTIPGYYLTDDDRKEVIEKIKKEEVLVKNWKIYIDLVGKNGISKMVLRRTLPIINARLSQLLNDVCDFDVEVGIDAKNDVTFYLIKDGVYKNLHGGSGFELTAAALALRSVLADMSTIPRCGTLVLDEVWGRVSKENYDNMKNLITKIAQSYDSMILISHLDEIRDWCQNHIVVKKENNVSTLLLRQNV